MSHEPKEHQHGGHGIADIFATGDRACCRWVIRWKDADGNPVALHGVDVITMRDGKIAEKLTYGTL